MVLISLGNFEIFLITLPVVDTSEYLIELCISEVFTQSTFMRLGFYNEADTLESCSTLNY